MTKQEIIERLAGLMDDTDVHVRLTSAHNKPFELPIKDLVYVPSLDDAPAYMVFILHQGLET